jgi:hypothetical protein
MRLLLSYRADPNAIVNEYSLLATAAQHGYLEAILMLLDAGANIGFTVHPPYVEVLNTGNRLALAVLLENRTDDLLREFDGHLLIWHAAVAASSLLPVVASETRREIEKLRASGVSEPPCFPPERLSRQEKNHLTDSLNLDQVLDSTAPVKRAVRRIKTLWS